MSHFSVLVVTDDKPSEDVLQEILLPWHEYECTGIDRYCVWVEKTDDPKVAADHAYDQIPGRPGRFGRYTNPAAKWDWWTIGGRYSGKLYAVDGALALTGRRSWVNRDEVIKGVDAVRRRDLDFDAMKRAQQDLRREWAEDCCQKAKMTLANLDVACQIAPIAHAEWLTLPEPRPAGTAYIAWLASHRGDWLILSAFAGCFELPEPAPGQSIAEWIDAAPAIASWAVVMDGQWFEKGKMGWWGISSDDKADWKNHFNDLFGLIRPDQWVTVVDCHI